MAEKGYDTTRKTSKQIFAKIRDKKGWLQKKLGYYGSITLLYAMASYQSVINLINHNYNYSNKSSVLKIVLKIKNCCG